jgi:hypothetical protein
MSLRRLPWIGLLIGCGTGGTPSATALEDTGTSGSLDLEATEICGAATSGEACRELSTDTWACGAVYSAPCDADPYDSDTAWRYEGCVPHGGTTCTQFTVWLQTEEGCRAFDGCYAPTDVYPSCDPDVDCP